MMKKIAIARRNESQNTMDNNSINEKEGIGI